MQKIKDAGYYVIGRITTFNDPYFATDHPECLIVKSALPAGLMSFMVLAFLQNIVLYSGTFVAQFSGSGARAACARATAQGIWLAVLCIPLSPVEAL